ncbi:MAG TPA: two-component regulator propeller domain-containing protein, partial [Flavilitoribacter sp.]|nr:two-component regulator propeller domain-containing protein [Flavilitoribacter sp.]
MKLIQQFGVLMALSFSWQVSLTGQPAGELPAITPSSIKLFDGKDYKEDYCTEYAVKDADGRLWLRTCDVMERPYLIQLLQYDGYRITPVELANPKLTSGANVELSGYDNRIGLYGCINGFTGEAYLFGYQAKLDSTLLKPLGKGTVTGIAPRKSGGYWVAVKKPDHIVFYTWDGTHLEEAAVLPYTGELKPLEKQASNISSGGSFFQEGDFLYYFDGPFPVIKYDLNKSAAQFISGGGATDANAETWVNPPGKYHLESGRGRIYYLEFGESPDFFLLDDQAGQFNSLNIVPEGGTGKAIFKDSQGNLLFAYLDNKAQQRAILLDTGGRYWEYSAMIRGLPRINSIASEDFKREAFVTTATGAYLSVAGLNSAIKTYLPGLSIREIGETGPGNYLIKIDRFRWFALNESEGKTSPFGGGGPCLSLISKEAKTGYITLVTDQERRLWLGSENELTRYPLNNRDTCITYSLNGIASKFPVFLKNGSLAAIDMNRLGNRQLFYFDPRKNESTPALSGGQPVKFNSPVTCLLEGGDRSLWIATINGLYRIRPDGDKVEHLGFTPDFEDFRSVVLHEDRQGRIWIGTVKGGLQILDPRLNKVVKSVTIKKGLANNTVVNILEDDDGDFWVGTYNGISILNANGDVINNLNEEDGLCFHEFNRYAHFRASNGKLLMGTLNGLNLIDPRKVKEELNNRDTTQIYLTEISYFDGRTQREVSLRNPDLAGRRIVLEADRRYLRITAGMSNYGFSQKNNFAYKLEGVNSDWNYLGGQHTINLSNLPAGKYRLLISGIDERGKWAAQPIELKIFAREFFYKQHWFYAALLAALFVLASLWIRYLRSEKMRLESEVRRRTRRIESDKELILQQAHELRKLDELKSRFFTNISHELRTPVALITTPIEQLIKSKNGELGEQAKKSLRMALNNGRNLLRLVEELLDLSKLDAGKLTLQETPTPLVDFCRGLFSAFESRANIRNIRYQYHSGLPPGNVYLVDRKCLEKIVNNLLSNALKFTHEGGCVELAVGAVAAPVDSDNGPTSGSPEGPPDFTLTIAVKDDGRGIPPEDLPHVFDRYFQTSREGLSIEG